MESNSKPINKATVEELKAEIAQREIEKKIARDQDVYDYINAIAECIGNRIGLRFEKTTILPNSEGYIFTSNDGLLAINFNTRYGYIQMYVMETDQGDGDFGIIYEACDMKPKKPKKREAPGDVCAELFRSLANESSRPKIMRALNAVYNPKVN